MEFEELEGEGTLWLCVNQSPIRYGFRADANAVRYSVNIAKESLDHYTILQGSPPTPPLTLR